LTTFLEQNKNFSDRYFNRIKIISSEEKTAQDKSNTNEPVTDEST